MNEKASATQSQKEYLIWLGLQNLENQLARCKTIGSMSEAIDAAYLERKRIGVRFAQRTEDERLGRSFKMLRRLRRTLEG